MKRTLIQGLSLGFLSVLLLPMTFADPAEQEVADPEAAEQEEPNDPENEMPEEIANQQCDLDITANLPADVDWRSVYMLRAPDGSAWQRSVMVRPHERIMLEEGETIDFEGTGQPFADNQIFIFSAENTNDQGQITIPGQDTCFNVGKGDNEGRFVYEINANHFWDNLGGEMIIDSFTRLEDTWDQKFPEETNQNFFIGTNMKFKEVIIDAEPKTSEGCRYLCDDKPVEAGGAKWRLQKSHIIDPTLFPDLIVNNPEFDALGAQDVAITRFQSNLYAGTGDVAVDSAETSNLAFKTMIMELMKQMLLGKIEMYPLAEPLPSITQTSMENAASGLAYSANAQKIAKAIRDSMSAGPGEAVREEALVVLAEEVAGVMGDCAGEWYGGSHEVCKVPDRDDMHEIFPSEPENSVGVKWSRDYVNLLDLWTDQTSPNSCILPTDLEEEDFKKNFWENGHNHSNQKRECGWVMNYAFGFSS